MSTLRWRLFLQDQGFQALPLSHAMLQIRTSIDVFTPLSSSQLAIGQLPFIDIKRKAQTVKDFVIRFEAVCSSLYHRANGEVAAPWDVLYIILLVVILIE